MSIQTKWAGQKYILTHDNMWEGQCPFWIGHANKMKIPSWKEKMLFKKWSNLLWKVKDRYSCKPARLYWRLNPDELSWNVKNG